MISFDVIQKKMKKLEEEMEVLIELSKLSFDEISKDYRAHGLSEHYLHLATTSLIAISREIVIGLRLRLPRSDLDIFKTLSNAGILPYDVASGLRVIGVSFKEPLKHTFLETEPRLLYDVLKSGVPNIKKFISCINTFLKRERLGRKV